MTSHEIDLSDLTLDKYSQKQIADKLSDMHRAPITLLRDAYSADKQPTDLEMRMAINKGHIGVGFALPKPCWTALLSLLDTVATDYVAKHEPLKLLQAELSKMIRDLDR